MMSANRTISYVIIIIGVIVLSLLFVIIGFIRNYEGNSSKTSNSLYNAKPESRPKQDILTPEEYKLHVQYLENQYRKSIHLKSFNNADSGVYANGRLRGTWHAKISHTNYYGYRVDNSAYDSLRDIFYAVSYAGHLYKLDTANNVSWTLLNHKIQLNPGNNNSANPIFFGVNLPDSTFRMIRGNDDLGFCEYSDDEGRNWTKSSGAPLSRSWANKGISIHDADSQKIILLCSYGGKLTPHISDDYGMSYSASSIQFNSSSYDVRLVKPYNMHEAYLVAMLKSSKKTELYKFNPSLHDFELIQTSGNTVSGSFISNVDATYYEGAYHFYISTNNGQNTVYYSNDLCKSWTLKNSGRDRTFECIHPTRPGILFSGFEDVKMSQDYGVTWSGFDHKLGWDLQHMKVYEKADGSHLTIVGLDFGCYISETPEDKENYTWVNNRAWYAMHYDAATSEYFNSIYMANQDRGSTAYLDTSENVKTIDVDGTDVLRIAYANHDLSVWSWFYYGRIKRRANVASGGTGNAVYDGLGNWWAAPIIASPNPSEDAIYAAYENNLQIFKYNAKNGNIEKSEHPFNFYSKWKSKLGGFGYSDLNRDLWYVTLLNGVFIYSRDGGDTWNRSSYVGSRPRGNDQTYNYHKNQLVIKTSAIDTMKVYYAGVGNVFLVSEDGGVSFTNMNQGLDIYRIRDFDVTPDDKFVFAACGYGGAWVYSVDEGQWFKMDDGPVPYVDFTDVQFIKEQNIARFATYGSGIIDYQIEGRDEILKSPGQLVTRLTNDIRIELTWQDENTETTGYIVERALYGGFSVIDTVAESVMSFTDSTVGFNKTYYYRVKAFSPDKVSHASNVAFGSTPEKGILVSSGWRVIYTDSEELNGEYAPVAYAFDNNASTFWHTRWQGEQPVHPHEVQVDMAQENSVAGFRYLPRQDGQVNGTISAYEFYVSNDTLDWGVPVHTGTFSSGPSWKEILFAEKSKGRYFRIVALSEINGSSYTSAAEFVLMYEPVVPLPPANLKVVPLSYSYLKLTWNDEAINEDGYVVEYWKNGVFEILDSVGKNVSSFLHKELPEGTEFKYRVRAYNAAGYSEYAGPVTDTTGVKVTGIGPVSQDEIKLFPVPVENVLNFELPVDNKYYSIQILDMNGRNMLSRELKKGTVNIDMNVEGLQAGYYIVYIKGLDHATTKKILKK